jgi:hypothetical protein
LSAQPHFALLSDRDLDAAEALPDYFAYKVSTHKLR